MKTTITNDTVLGPDGTKHDNVQRVTVETPQAFVEVYTLDKRTFLIIQSPDDGRTLFTITTAGQRAIELMASTMPLLMPRGENTFVIGDPGPRGYPEA